MASNSASSAAALAAFNSLRNKNDEDLSRYNKIPTKQNTNSSQPDMAKIYQSPQPHRSLPNVPRIQTKNISTVRSTTPITPKPTTPKYANPRLTPPRKSTPTESLSATALSNASTPRARTPCADTFTPPISVPAPQPVKKSPTLSVDACFKHPHTPSSFYGKSPTNSTTHLPSDMIKSIKSSIESKVITNSSKRLSTNHEPLKSMKTTNKSRASHQEPLDKNQAMLNKLRLSIDLKRISTPVLRLEDAYNFTPPNKLDGSSNFTSPIRLDEYNLPDELLKSPILSGETSSSDEKFKGFDSPKNFFQLNKSYSSFNSNPLDSDYVSTTEFLDEATLLKKHSSPIPIPRSTHAYARVPGGSFDRFYSSDRLHGSSLDSLQGFKKSGIEKLTPDEEGSKLRRKPPPPSQSSNSDFERNNDKGVGLLSGYDTDNEDEKSQISMGTLPKIHQFKRFPDIKTRHHIRPEKLGSSFFRLGKHKENHSDVIDSLASDEDNLSDDEDTGELSTSNNEYISANNLLNHQNQPVKLKKTMRKETRKTKKKLFNDNKPWKNHSELNYLTEQERKRYEGLFVSNKGIYFDRVVTKLVGVDYDKDVGATTVSEEEDDSTRAAKLSANVLESKRNLHSLKAVNVDQLIHGSVVKRIWKRSRLPNETLQSIWNLVDYRKDGTLNKPEFMVGMWLIDQCLYGRKLPKKIDDIVWENLGNIGVSVVLKKKLR